MDRRLLASAVFVMLAGVTASVPAEAATVGGPASASRAAKRDIAFTPGAQCDLVTVQALSNRHPDVRQFVIVASDSWASTTATLQIAARSTSGQWRCQQAPIVARLGRSGSRPLADRRSGDGTTPAGSFPLGSVTAWDGQQFQFFGNRPDPGVRGSYRLVRNEDCWGATPNTASYQALVNNPECSSPNEWLTSIGDVYGHAAVIGANLDPISGNAPGEPALAAAIFLHRNSYLASGASRPTSGCVSLAQEDLDIAVRLIDPGLGVQFAIGELSWLRDTA
jgi:L,D-peptidoglycan transpeptidase YkuD (ErfK/YbiS/YcfS/YnhG family)